MVAYKKIVDEVTIETALYQAAQTLDIASVLAAKTENIEALAGIAHSWMELAARLGNPGGEEHDLTSEPIQIGFAAHGEEEA